MSTQILLQHLKKRQYPPCELCLWLDLGPKPILESFHFESRSASNSP